MEYGLAGSLIMVVAIGAMMTMGGQFEGLMASLKDDMSSSVENASTKAKSIKQAKAAHELAVRQAAEAAANRTSGFSSMSGSTQTLGANGNDIRAQASVIQNAAKRAFEDGDISREQYDLLLRMAQMGHEMALMEGALAMARGNANGSSGAYANTQVNYNGGSYSPQELAGIMGASVVEFGSLRYHAEQMGLFGDPNIGPLINSASGDILGKGGASEDISRDAAKAVQVGGITTSEDIHQDASDVCVAGKHRDTGVSCSQ